tara:strand:+ start:1008 stop:1247 length:240 start_codon:yes stop_codon:yes gene_type:complete
MHIKCLFPDDLIRRPIIYDLATRFTLVSNIKQAQVTSEIGWVILEITGEEYEVSNGIEWLKQLGVTVEALEKEDGNGKS